MTTKLVVIVAILAVLSASSEARLGRKSRRLFRTADELVGGGRVYGEYSNGPYTAGAEYNWDAMEEDVGGGRVYGEYRNGPYTAGAEYNWDAMEKPRQKSRLCCTAMTRKCLKCHERNKAIFNDVFAEFERSGRRLSRSWLYTLATASLRSGPTGSCVATTLGNMDRLGIPSFSGGTTADPNNSRGAMVQMIKAGRWKSMKLPGSRWTTIRSAYGTVGAYVIGADAYEKMAYARQIPSGAIIFQTRWGWGANSGASGNDMGIVRDRGRYTFNYKLMNPIIYSNAKEVVILIPK